MKKRIFFALVGVLVVAGVLAGTKALQIGAMIEQGKKFVPPPQTVTATGVVAETWTRELTAVGTLSAVQGVTVSAEAPGKVVEIAFEPGTEVKRGDLLIRQDTSVEDAQLPGLLAQVSLARSELNRATKMSGAQIISQSDQDKAQASYDQAQAQANNLRAVIAKKTVRAPFSGRLGIRQVSLGQQLAEGQPIVTLQDPNPIFSNFSLPQQQLALVQEGERVLLTCDALPGETREGLITTINPLVDDLTRSVQIQATFENPDGKLRPGMFVNLSLPLPEPLEVLAIPETAVLYAPYRDSVFVIEENPDGEGKTLRQQFVRLGEKRGDYVDVVDGLKAAEQVVSTGVFKLRNGQGAVIDNSLAPDFKKAPTPENN